MSSPVTARAGRARWVSAVAAAVRDLGRLVLPVACGGCGACDVVLCPACLALLGAPRRCEEGAGRLDLMDGRPPLPVWTLGTYTGPMRELVVAWKDRGRTDLAAPLARAAARAGRELAPALSAGIEAAGGSPARARPDSQCPRRVLLVVPAPSTAAARRRRGEDPVGGLARAVAQGCREGALVADATRVLVRHGRGRDQVGLGSRARARNLSGHVRVRRSSRDDLAGCVVLLVDDILTTGATLAACERALTDVGALVIGAVTLAATPSPGDARPSPGDQSGALVPAPRQV